MFSIKCIVAAKSLAAVSIAGVLFSTSAQADDWTGKDKEYHLIAGALVGTAATAYTKSPADGFGAGVAVGILKEFYDSRHPAQHDASVKDAVVTALGALAGAYDTGLIIVPGAVWYSVKW